MPRLRRKERCPIHNGRLDCCGRTRVNPLSLRKARQYVMVGPGVKRFEDGHEERSPAAIKALKHRKLREHPFCIFCGQKFFDYREVDLCHRVSKGMNGWKRDDSPANTVLGHHASNLECGSTPIASYMAAIAIAGKKFPCEV